MGVGFETPISFGGLTLAENLAYFAHLYRGPTADPIELLERVGLADDARLAASKMSKGMGVRLNVARALLHIPLSPNQEESLLSFVKSDKVYYKYQA